MFKSKVLTWINNHLPLILSQVRIIAAGVMIALLQIALSIWLKRDPFDWFTTPSGLLSLLFFFIFFSEIAFMLVNISAFIFWQTGKKLGARGSFSEISIALLWSLVYTLIPFGLFVAILETGKFEPDKPEIDPLGFFITGLCSFGILASWIYCITHLIKKFSEVHQISSRLAVKVFFLGALLQAPLIIPSLLFISSHMRTLFIVLVPPSVQILVTISVITLGAKVLNKMRKLQN